MMFPGCTKRKQYCVWCGHSIECKWSASDFDAANLQAFRRPYPQGDNLVVANDVERSFTRSYGGLPVRFVSLSDLIAEVTRQHRPRAK